MSAIANEGDKFATSGGHWYAADGSPAYTQPNKSKPGEVRGTTLRDAKKLGLVPSVTGILNMAAKPQLERWKLNQLMMAALTLPAIDGESVRDYEARLWKDSNEQSNSARDKGTEIHGYIESHFENGSHADNPYVIAVVNCLNAPLLVARSGAPKSHFLVSRGTVGKSIYTLLR